MGSRWGISRKVRPVATNPEVSLRPLPVPPPARTAPASSRVEHVDRGLAVRTGGTECDRASDLITSGQVARAAVEAEMATKITVALEDDHDGSPAAETVRFPRLARQNAGCPCRRPDPNQQICALEAAERQETKQRRVGDLGELGLGLRHGALSSALQLSESHWVPG